MINERKSSYKRDERRDLLSNLVDANEELFEDGDQRLEEEELIGAGSSHRPTVHLLTSLSFRKHFHVLCCWIWGKDVPVSAGGSLVSAVPQTSGSTLSFTLNMLAVHQEEQETLFRHIQDILPDGRQPVSAKGRHRLIYQA